MTEDMRRITNRLYTYLKRFVLEDGLAIDIIFVTSMIIYGDTTKYHQKCIKEDLGI